MKNIQTASKLLSLVFCVVVLLPLPSHALTAERVEEFIRATAAGSSTLASFHHPDELALSRRFEINYEGVPHKFMLGYDLEPEIKRLVLESASAWSVQVQEEDDGWAVAVFRVPSHAVERAFYFHDGYFVTPVRYFTRDFESRRTRFFELLIEDPATFHPEAARALDEYVVEAAREMELSSEQLELLEREKIVYVLCRNPASIEQLTGYKIRGMGVVSHDYVVTTFSTHYHEVAHLLAAIKLASVQPVTHPLLREGLAVALGGRGGRDAPVILDVGCFLFRSSLVELDSLRDEDAYLKEAVSFSYPASGIYVRFLIDELGLDGFLDLYRKYSHPDRDTVNCVINPADLPGNDAWKNWLAEWRQFDVVRPLDKLPSDGRAIVEIDGATVLDCGDEYCFSLERDITFSESETQSGYRSSRFAELFPQGSYSGQRYLISIRDNEIGVFDLYLNTLLANRVPSFIFPPPELSGHDGPVVFSVNKSVFDEPLEALIPAPLD